MIDVPSALSKAAPALAFSLVLIEWRKKQVLEPLWPRQGLAFQYCHLLPMQTPCIPLPQRSLKRILPSVGASARAHCPRAAPPDADYTVLPKGESLKQWVRSHGGYIHEALSLVDDAPCGCRGIIATRDISMEELEAGPLISIPQKLQLTDCRAQAVCEESNMFGDESVTGRLASLSNTQQLAAALAYEVALGERSFWHAYCSILPVEHPSPWLLPNDDLDSLIAGCNPVRPTIEHIFNLYSLSCVFHLHRRDVGSRVSSLDETSVFECYANATFTAF